MERKSLNNAQQWALVWLALVCQPPRPAIMSVLCTCRLQRGQQVAQQLPEVAVLGPLRGSFLELRYHLGALERRLGQHTAQDLQGSGGARR